MLPIMATHPQLTAIPPRRVAAEPQQVMDIAARTDQAITQPGLAMPITQVTLTSRDRPMATTARMHMAIASDMDRGARESQSKAKFGQACATATPSAQRA